MPIVFKTNTCKIDKSGNSLRSVKDLQSGEELQVRLEDGTLQTKITSVKSQQ